jgi:hypothetical protein
MMQTSISWALGVHIPSGPNLTLTSALQVDAYERISLTVPHSAAAPPAEVEVDVQPGPTDRVRLLLIRSSVYGDDLQVKVHATGNPAHALNDTLFLVGEGNLGLLGADLDKLFIINTLGQEATIEIIVGRLVTP